MQGHETYASPIEHDPTTAFPQSPTHTPDPNTPSPHIPTPLPPPQISDLDLHIAFRKGSRTCPNTIYTLDRFFSYVALFIDHHAFIISLNSYSVPKNVSEILENSGWFSMQKKISAL
jgi:hypothetical protein